MVSRAACSSGRPRQVRLRPALAVALLAVALVGCLPVQRQVLVEATNAARRANGLPAVSRSDALDVLAQQWADAMATRRQVSHRPEPDRRAAFDRVLPGWAWNGENVGCSDDLADLPPSFFASSVHRHVLLNPQAQLIGIGVARGGDGQYYVTVLFAGMR